MWLVRIRWRWVDPIRFDGHSYSAGVCHSLGLGGVRVQHFLCVIWPRCGMGRRCMVLLDAWPFSRLFLWVGLIHLVASLCAEGGCFGSVCLATAGLGLLRSGLGWVVSASTLKWLLPFAGSESRLPLPPTR